MSCIGCGCLSTNKTLFLLQAKRMLLEALASGEIALKMGSALAAARIVFRERELQGNAELQVRRRRGVKPSCGAFALENEVRMSTREVDRR